VIWSRRLIWAGYIARIEEGKSAVKIITWTPTGKRHLRRLRHWWEYNIVTDVEERGINTRNWVDSALDRDYWRPFWIRHWTSGFHKHGVSRVLVRVVYCQIPHNGNTEVVIWQHRMRNEQGGAYTGGGKLSEQRVKEHLVAMATKWAWALLKWR
jgi:hypothetical protein